MGERKRQIQVWLDGEKLYSYNLNVDQVRAALAAQNVEDPRRPRRPGRARTVACARWAAWNDPRISSASSSANVGGTPVRISDIGQVVDGVEEPRSLARLDGKPAVVLEVRKQAGTNTLDVIQAVKDADRGAAEHACRRTSRSPTRATSRSFIEESFKAVQEHLVLGGFLRRPSSCCSSSGAGARR